MTLEQIPSRHVFPMVVLFMLGSAWLFGLGSEAKESAWLAILTGTSVGIPVIAVQLLLLRHFPHQTIIQSIPAILGRWLGKPVALCYVLYFLYLGARVTRDFGELTVVTILPETPISVVVLVKLAVIAYAVRHGLEVLARTMEFMMPIGLILVLLGTFLVIPQFRGERLLPVMGEGFGPIWNAAVPLIVTVPFGEVVVFGTILPQVTGPYRRWVLGAALLSGLLLAYLSFVETGVLGTHLLATAHFPLLDLFRAITVGDFLDRLDAPIVLLLELGGFAKVSLFLYAATQGLAQWLGLKDYRPLVLPMTAVVAALGFTIAASYPQHIQIGLRFVPSQVHLLMQVILPILLLLIWRLRQSIHRGSNRNA